MVPIVESITCDIPRVIIGNIRNSGDFVPGIPRDFEVEIPTLVSRRGIQGIQTRGLPRPCWPIFSGTGSPRSTWNWKPTKRVRKSYCCSSSSMDPWSTVGGTSARFCGGGLGFALPR